MTSQGVTGEGERPARRRRVEALPFTAEAKALDSRLRGNDEPRRDGRRVNDSFAVGEWKLMLRKIETKALDYARRLSRALRAIRCANVRPGMLPPQSRLRGNDEPRRDGRRGSDPLAVGEWVLMLRKIETKTLDYTRLLSRALRAIRCANVRSGILPLRSRGNDERRAPGLRLL